MEISQPRAARARGSVARPRVSPPNAEKLAEAVVKVGGGRGFVVKVGHASFVITAAHCLPHLPPAHPASYTHERTYAELLGPLGCAKPAVWAECLFVDPVTDIAVLGSPDGQELYDQADAYEALTDERPVLSIGPAPEEGPAWLLKLDGRWSRCVVGHQGELPTRPWGSPIGILEGREVIEFGMSGSPILADDGTAIGVVSVSNGPNPHLMHHLPGWMLHKLLHDRAKQRLRKSKGKVRVYPTVHHLLHALQQKGRR